MLQDPQGLIEAMGGRPSFVQKLNFLFVQPERIDGMGGMGSTRRVTFKGYATDEVCVALVGAIGMVLTDESEETE